MSQLGRGYSCNPLLPPSVAQACLSTKYKTQVRSGNLPWCFGAARFLAVSST